MPAMMARLFGPTPIAGVHLAPVARMLEASSSSQPTSWDELAGIVLPSLKPVGWLAGQASHLAPIHRPIAPFLIETVAIDMEHAMGFVNGAAADVAGVGPERFFAQASANLGRHPLDVVAAPEVAPGALAIEGPDGYASSWLVRPDLLRSAGRQLPGALLVFAPTREVLVLVGDGRPEAVAAALEWAMAVYSEAARPLPPWPTRWTSRRSRHGGPVPAIRVPTPLGTPSGTWPSWSTPTRPRCSRSSSTEPARTSSWRRTKRAGPPPARP